MTASSELAQQLVPAFAGAGLIYASFRVLRATGRALGPAPTAAASLLGRDEPPVGRVALEGRVVVEGAPIVASDGRACAWLSARRRRVTRETRRSAGKVSVSESSEFLGPAETFAAPAQIRARDGQTIDVDLADASLIGADEQILVEPGSERERALDGGTEIASRVERVEERLLVDTRVGAHGVVHAVARADEALDEAGYRGRPRGRFVLTSAEGAPLTVLVGGRGRVARRAIYGALFATCIALLLVALSTIDLLEARALANLGW